LCCRTRLAELEKERDHLESRIEDELGNFYKLAMQLTEVEKRAQEAESRLRDFLAEALERGEKDRPFIIGVQDFLSQEE